MDNFSAENSNHDKQDNDNHLDLYYSTPNPSGFMGVHSGVAALWEMGMILCTAKD